MEKVCSASQLRQTEAAKDAKRKLSKDKRRIVELDKALVEYAVLKAQAVDFDPLELYEARRDIRPAQEKTAEKQLEEILQKKPSLSLLLNAKQEVSRLIGEDAEERQARQMVMQRQAAQQKRSLRSAWKKNDFER